MYSSINISGYRSLSRLTIEPLGRINLLVGENNSGKTSILEAIHLLADGARGSLSDVALRRGECLVAEDDVNGRQYLQDIRQVFSGRELADGQRVQITGTVASGNERCVLLRVVTDEDSPVVDGARTSGPLNRPSERLLRIEIDSQGVVGEPLLRPWLKPDQDGLVAIKPARIQLSSRKHQSVPRFVATSGLSPVGVALGLDQFKLRAEEKLILDAIRIVEPRIKAIATVGEASRHVGEGSRGIIVGLEDADEPVPIGSLGDGVWRLLGLALHLVLARDSVLLVDEIDTGLHHTVLDKMWRLICGESQKLNVQVFATTHSRDCVESLASIAHANVFEHSEVMIHRIEAGRDHSVPYSEAEIVAVAEAGIEVR